MIIDKNIAKFIVFSEDSLHNALRKINENKARIIFCVSSSGELEGALSDGDVRRWITSSKEIDIEVPAIAVANKGFFSLSHEAPHQDIEASFSDRINIIPLVDKYRHLVAIARHGEPELSIAGVAINASSPAFIIAEIGNNHNGSLDLAKTLIDKAVEAGATCAKFQMRSLAQLYKNSGNANDVSEDLGSQYTLDLLTKFQLPTEKLFAAFDYCKQKGIIPLCTPWDVESLNLLETYGMPAYKLASADLTNPELLEAIAKTGKPVICSTGMSNENEIVVAVRLLRKHNAQFVLLHCNSTYPAPFKDIHLQYMDRLRSLGDCVIGYSGHERGISVPIAAVAKGAKVIEKHFTLDRSMEGNDHRVSLLPDEFKSMVLGIREVEQALGSKDARKITQGEMMNRETLAKSLVAARPIEQGEIISADMVSTKSPGKGVQPYRLMELIGKPAKRGMEAGDFFYASDLETNAVKARHYRFSRPFGVPIRYHDLLKMSSLSNFDLMEFHLSYKDMEEPVEKHLGDNLFNMDLVVHSPELFAGDHILDLCSPDPDYRKRSICELQKVVDVTRQLKPYFLRAKKPMIIVNAGGFSQDGPLSAELKPKMYDMIADAFSQLDTSGVEIIPQTMPPFPWHFGGQRYHNLFMSAEDIDLFCQKNKIRICLDISHSQLACIQDGTSFKEFLVKVAPHSAHLHLVDAKGVDEEGLQIGEGIVDFALVSDILAELAPNASFIPEIWQGHKNDGEGFWVALEKLERWF